MILKINNKKFSYFNSLSLTLKYDSVASVFSFDLLFDPGNPEHRSICKPGQYLPVTIEQDGELLLTGVLCGNSFTGSSKKELAGVGGYSTPGTLENCDIPEKFSQQTDGLTLKQIAERLLKDFKIEVVADASVLQKVNSKYKKVTCTGEKKIKEYLSTLASQQHVIVTHNERGQLVFTEAKANALPIANFEQGVNRVKGSLTFDGYQMHSHITVRKQASKDSPNAALETVTNPYVKNVYRPRVVHQSSGDQVNTGLAAKNILADELKGIALTVELPSWYINGKIIRPNNIITYTDPEIYLFKKTRFFIEQVQFTGNESNQTAVLTCYLPEVYNGQTPVNIFD